MTFIDFCFMLVIMGAVGLVLSALIWALETLASDDPDDRRIRPYDWAQEEE